MTKEIILLSINALITYYYESALFTLTVKMKLGHYSYNLKAFARCRAAFKGRIITLKAKTCVWKDLSHAKMTNNFPKVCSLCMCLVSKKLRKYKVYFSRQVSLFCKKRGLVVKVMLVLVLRGFAFLISCIWAIHEN